MSINPSLLISANVLQDYLVDKSTGLPLSGGIVTLWQDNNRTTLKNWYYQTGSPPNYTYTTLPNPMTLSSAGTICDANGVDALPLYYPFSETDNLTPQTYFIEIQNSQGTFQESRQNFPFTAPNSTPINTGIVTEDNYVINNVFWRNIGTFTPPTSGSTLSWTLAPSNHDGFSMSDLQYVKNNVTATETITFTKFPQGASSVMNGGINGDITPEYYVNHVCQSGASGETLKAYQFPIALHVKTLDSVNATITIQAKALPGSGSNLLYLYAYQFLGTGVTSPAPQLIGGSPITLSNVWQKYTISYTFPTSANLTLGAGGDDAWYLQVGMPLNSAFNISYTLPSLYLCNPSQVPENWFTTYDQVDSIVNTPRTGDVRTSLNNFVPFGWAPANDGTIGNYINSMSTSNATTRANQDTWPLFNLIWTLFNASQSLAPMFNSSGSSVSYGASAIADFTALNAISLTKNAGRVIAAVGGTPTAYTIGQAVGGQTQMLTVANLPNHTHDPGTPGTQFWENSSTINFAQSGSGVNGSGALTTGGITGFSSQTGTPVFQPTVFYNVFFKL